MDVKTLEIILASAVGSVAVGWLVKKSAVLPALMVAWVKDIIRRRILSGQIDRSTVKMLRRVAAALFDWVDEELPDGEGPEKMDRLIDMLGTLPVIGWIIRADPADARRILQVQYDAIDAVAKAEASKMAQPDLEPPPGAPGALAA